MKKCILMMLCGLSAAVLAGSLNPPAGPTAGTMKTLVDIEPRTAIRQADIPLTISASGSYYLAENLTHTGINAGIIVGADNVTIDLNGFQISGAGTGSEGISLNGRSNVEVRNGTICNFYTGLTRGTSVGSNHRISGLRILSCSMYGIYLESSHNCQVRDCTITNSMTLGGPGSAYGIVTGGNGIVSGNTLYGNGTNSPRHLFGIRTGSGSVITGNTISGLGASATSSAVRGILASSGCRVTGNQVYDVGDMATSDVYGILVDPGCVVSENSSYSNGTSATGSIYGIYTLSGCTISNNSTFDNGESATGMVFGIRTFTGCTLTGNTSFGNGTGATRASGSSHVQVWGILAGTHSSVIGNTVCDNGKSITVPSVVYGIYLAGYNVVNNNTASDNDGTNMNTLASCSYGTNVPQLP